VVGGGNTKPHLAKDAGGQEIARCRHARVEQPAHTYRQQRRYGGGVNSGPIEPNLDRILIALAQLRGEHGHQAAFDAIQEAAETQARQLFELLGALRAVAVVSGGHLAALGVLDDEADAALRPRGQCCNVDQSAVVHEAGDT
jgi:hypothetical protein